jgi:hypothetical protein
MPSTPVSRGAAAPARICADRTLRVVCKEKQMLCIPRRSKVPDTNSYTSFPAILLPPQSARAQPLLCIVNAGKKASEGADFISGRSAYVLRGAGDFLARKQHILRNAVGRYPEHRILRMGL